VLAVGADRLGTSSPWVSDGIVSAVDARVGASDGPSTTGLIETDATGGMGVAGGALVDPGSGAVVGIVLAPVGDGGATYALPIPAVTRIVDELAEHGHVERGWLGLRGEDSPDGVRVAELTAAGPADRAGIRVGDLVADVDGRPVPTMADLRAEVRARAPGDDVVLGVRRDGSRLDLRIRLEDGPHTSSTPTVGAASGG
jgi:S1-C subfamily serine protease